MSRFWASWWEDADCDEVWEGRKDVKGIVSEWDSGHRWTEKVDDEYEQTSMVAVVEAADEDAARVLVERNRGVIEWRFLDQTADDWTPGDRFPMPETAAT